MAQVMQSASELAADMGGHKYSELRWIFPGASPSQPCKPSYESAAIISCLRQCKGCSKLGHHQSCIFCATEAVRIQIFWPLKPAQ